MRRVTDFLRPSSRSLNHRHGVGIRTVPRCEVTDDLRQMVQPAWGAGVRLARPPSAGFLGGFNSRFFASACLWKPAQRTSALPIELPRPKPRAGIEPATYGLTG